MLDAEPGGELAHDVGRQPIGRRVRVGRGIPGWIAVEDVAADQDVVAEEHAIEGSNENQAYREEEPHGKVWRSATPARTNQLDAQKLSQARGPAVKLGGKWSRCSG